MGNPVQVTQEELADWADPQVQLVYRMLCDPRAPDSEEEHWEGWVARRIVAALTPARTYEVNISDEEIDAAIRHGFGDATADALKADETGAAS